jgi:hypothetical protein
MRQLKGGDMFQRLLAVVCLSVLCVPSLAFAQEYGLMTISAHDGNRASLDFGLGYDLRTQKAKLRSCVTFDKKKRKLDDSDESSSFSFVSSNSEIAAAKSMSASAKAGASFGGIGASASYKTSKSSKHKVHGQSKAIMARNVVIGKSKVLKVGSIKLKDEYVKMLSDPKTKGKFVQECGDALVFGLQSGAEFYGIATLTKVGTKSSSKKKKSASVSAGYGPFSASGSLSSAKKNSKDISDGSLLITIEGTEKKGKTPTSLKGLAKAFKNFKGKNKRTIKAHLAAYSEVVENWPLEEDFFRPVAEENLSEMMDSLWTLQALVDEADFITSNPSLFALGMSKKTRKKIKGQVKSLGKKWNKQLSKMKPIAKKCYETGESNDCKVTKVFDFDVDNRRAQLPERYDVNCKNFAQLLSATNYDSFKEFSIPKDELSFQKKTGKGKQVKDRKRLNLLAKARVTKGAYKVDLKIQVRKDWTKGKNKTTVWNNYSSPFEAVNVRLDKHGLGNCVMKTNPVEIKAKDSAKGQSVSVKKQGIKVSCNVGHKHSVICKGAYRLSDMPLPTIHRFDNAIERRHGSAKGKSKKGPRADLVKARLKRIKSQRAKAGKSKAGKRAKARKAKRKKARSKARKMLKKRKKCKKGKKGKKCRQKRKKKKGKKKK